jgi:hypothetical protein
MGRRRLAAHKASEDGRLVVVMVMGMGRWRQVKDVHGFGSSVGGTIQIHM